MELNNLDILAIIKNHKNKSLFLGVFPRNLLPQQVKYPSCMIINTDPSYKKGQHWISIYYNRDQTAEFFDSYGYPPSHYNMDKYLKKTSKSFSYNKKTIQSDNSKLCGYYSCLFILFKLNSKSLDKLLNFFTSSSIENDKKLLKLLKSNFY